MRDFARHFRIGGIAGFGPREFMQRAKLEVLKLMRENRRTRVLIILNCEMIREELFNVDLQPGSGETELLNPHFQSNVIVSLEATDESEEFDTSMDTIQERIHNFNQRGSKWRFHRVTCDISSHPSYGIQTVEWQLRHQTTKIR